MLKKSENHSVNRRNFIKTTGLGVGVGLLGISQINCSNSSKQKQQVIQGFEDTPEETQTTKKWEPVSDRKIRVGLVGYGVCKFSADFGFQNHPNVEVAAVSDLIPERCAELSKVTRCKKLIRRWKNW